MIVTRLYIYTYSVIVKTKNVIAEPTSGFTNSTAVACQTEIVVQYTHSSLHAPGPAVVVKPNTCTRKSHRSMYGHCAEKLFPTLRPSFGSTRTSSPRCVRVMGVQRVYLFTRWMQNRETIMIQCGWYNGSVPKSLVNSITAGTNPARTYMQNQHSVVRETLGRCYINIVLDTRDNKPTRT